MNNQEIFALMDHFDASAAATMKLTTGDFSLELSKAPVPVQAAAAPAPVVSDETASPAGDGNYITAPLVGTFYAAPAPDAPPFVKVGDAVKKGQTVCLLEAMKMMSEVQAPCDCVIEEIVAGDGTLVSFGQPLVRYREG